MPITPDAKDWTWVLERPCPECGFDARAIDPEQVGPLTRENAAWWQRLLARYLVHDPIHHVHDVERGFATSTSTA